MDNEKRYKEKATDAEYDYLIGCLKRNEPLAEGALELALEFIQVKAGEKHFEPLEDIGTKMKAARPSASMSTTS